LKQYFKKLLKNGMLLNFAYTLRHMLLTIRIKRAQFAITLTYTIHIRNYRYSGECYRKNSMDYKNLIYMIRLTWGGGGDKRYWVGGGKGQKIVIIRLLSES
jgi:hypothetical protein